MSGAARFFKGYCCYGMHLPAVAVNGDAGLLKPCRSRIRSVYVTPAPADDSARSRNSSVPTTYRFRTAVDHDIDRKHHKLEQKEIKTFYSKFFPLLGFKINKRESLSRKIVETEFASHLRSFSSSSISFLLQFKLD